MHIGVPKEIKNHEYRVALTPGGVRELVARAPCLGSEGGGHRGRFARTELSLG